MAVNNIKTTIEAVMSPYLVALEQKYKATLDTILAQLATYNETITRCAEETTTALTTIQQQNTTIAQLQQTVEEYTTAIDEIGVLDVAAIILLVLPIL